jgi:hypothetical protein
MIYLVKAFIVVACRQWNKERRPSPGMKTGEQREAALIRGNGKIGLTSVNA